MGQGDKRHSVSLKLLADQGVERSPGKVPLDSKAAHQNDNPWSNQRQLSFKVRPAEGDFTTGRSPVPTASPGLARETLGDSSHVDVLSELIFADSNTLHPAKELASRAPGKWAANLEFCNAGRLADQHDAIFDAPRDDRSGAFDIP